MSDEDYEVNTTTPCERCNERLAEWFIDGHLWVCDPCIAPHKNDPYLTDIHWVGAEDNDTTKENPPMGQLKLIDTVPHPGLQAAKEALVENTTPTTPIRHIVAGTGSRSLRTAPIATKHNAWNRLIAHLTVLKEAHGDNLRGVSGMAEGWDEACAKAFIELEIPWLACIPNKGYGAYYWGRKSLTGKNRLEEFNALIAQAKKVEYVCEGLYVPGTKYHANFARNDRMVEFSDEFMVWNAESSGTAHCVKAIVAANKPYVELDK